MTNNKPHIEENVLGNNFQGYLALKQKVEIGQNTKHEDINKKVRKRRGNMQLPAETVFRRNTEPVISLS